MIESRCGILCSECEYREQTGCKGCTEMEKPFWGEGCPVKACCEEKAHDHCESCGDFVAACCISLPTIRSRETAASELNNAKPGNKTDKCPAAGGAFIL